MTQPLARPVAAQPLPSASLAQASRGRDYRALLLAVVLVALWLLRKPWEGIWHDAQLYTAQALRLLHPERFQHDLYFLFGSQDAFTLFSPLYATCISAFGLTGAAVLLQVLGSALWLAGAASLLRSFLRGFHFWLGLAFLVALPSDFGPTPGIFTLGEPFLTPRLFAEAFSLFALGLVVRGKWAWGAGWLLLALLLHPLMAVGACLVAALFLAWGYWRPASALAAAGAAVVLGAALLGIAPFDRILLQMDPEWLKDVVWMAPMVTWDAWHASDWLSRTAVALSLVLAAAWLSDGARARFYACVALAGVLGLLASWAGTGLTHNLLLIQVQPWRVLWLAQLASAVALAWLLAAFWQRGQVFRLLLVALLMAELNRNTFGGALAALAAWAMCWLVRQPALPEMPRRTYLIAMAGVLAVGSPWLIELEAATNGVWSKVAYGSELAEWIWVSIRFGFGAVLGAALLWCLWRWSVRPQRLARVMAWSIALLVLAAAGAWCQQRAAQALRMSATAQQAAQARFLPLIPAHAVVYWQNDVRASWFVLQRSSYASSAQLSGAAFNRGTAIEGARRLARLERLGMADAVREHDHLRRLARLSQLPQPSLAGLDYVCADPVLDFVVLREPLGSSVVAQMYDAELNNHYYLHDCARQRASLASR